MLSTPMEKIKSYHSIKTFLNEEQRTIIANMLNLKPEDITRRLEGKEAEYEFLLKCHLLNKVKDIIAFEEGVSRLTDTVTTDFLFITEENKRMAIEVKSTEKETWKISTKIFQKKQEFARLMNAELFFAIRIKSHWMLLSGKYIQNRNYKIEIDSMINSKFSILGETSFIIRNSLKILSIYTTDSNKSLGIEHPQYGYLQRYIIKTGNKEIFRITPSSKEKIIIAMALEAFQDAASIHHQNIEALGKGRTLVIEELNENTIFNLSHILVAPIKHLISDLDLTYDFSSYITEIVDTKDKSSINDNYVKYVLGLLCKSGVELYEIVKNNTIPFEKIYDLSNIK